MPHQVVIVGQLASMTRAEAARVVALTGGALTERVTRATDLVVVGGRGPQLARSGRLPIQLTRAHRLAEEGVLLAVWPEERWLRSVGLADDAAGVCKRFTASQMADALHVPRPKLDRWIAAGLVRPVDTSAGVGLFEFQQVAAVRTLADLVQSGISLAKLRRATARLARWLPDAHQPLLELSLDEDVRRLVVRTSDGRLAEPSGQLLLEFDRDEPAASAESVAFCATENEADAFRRAVQCEEDRPQEAAAIYRELIAKRGPHPTLAFNLANALYAAEDPDRALAQYEVATALDPQHAGAWNNLANVLAELDRPEEAIGAYRRALALDPRLADARFNLAQTLVEIGRSDEAVLHWRAYLAADSESSWADYARERLESRPI
ncbi:MAG: tetratricopeptide repeat protein [Planctomycetaceae bacterium]|nr:tetratricopeptide repeat protein [Planctomycetaceae bacterium]